MLSESNEQEELIKKIANKEAKILVLGLGQVGLPTAFAFLERGYEVIGFDINETLVGKINAGSCPLPEKHFSEILSKHMRTKKFSATCNPDSILEADVVLVCVATPLNNSRTNADLTILDGAIQTIGKRTNRMKLIVIESTIPPGTMKKYVIPKMELITGKKAGEHFLISFCPERISPGNALNEFLTNNRLIGAQDANSLSVTHNLLSKVTDGKIIQTDTSTAELAKLAENAYRDVNIAFANELALICESYGVDSSEVIKLANSHPRVNIHFPGPGVGGPCLPKDPYLLVAEFNTNNSIVRTARSINDKMPQHVVDLVLNTGNRQNHFLNKSILLLGSSYKPNVNDTRNSPTELIVQRLAKEGFTEINVHDPYSEDAFGAHATDDLQGSLSSAEFVILITAHSDYLGLKPEMFRKDATLIDTVRALDGKNFMKAGIKYIAIG